MSFSGDVRAELAQIIPRGTASREAAAAAILVNIAGLSRTEEGEILLTLSAGNRLALRKCFTLIQKNDKISPDSFASGQDLRFLLTGAKARKREIEAGAETLPPPQGLLSLVRRLQLTGREGDLPALDGTLPRSFVTGQAARAYLRETFLCIGFMSDPGRSYHLEFRCFSQAQADQLREVLADQGIHAGLTHRKKYYIVYLKDSEDIVTLLQLMGASVGLMATENARIYKEVRNNVNRRVNCETANIGKTVESSARQLEDIGLLRERGILEQLPVQIRQAAELREEHPGASLSELGELAEPPVSRSGMNHRLRRIASLAQKERQADQ